MRSAVRTAALPIRARSWSALRAARRQKWVRDGRHAGWKHCRAQDRPRRVGHVEDERLTIEDLPRVNTGIALGRATRRNKERLRVWMRSLLRAIAHRPRVVRALRAEYRYSAAKTTPRIRGLRQLEPKLKV